MAAAVQKEGEDHWTSEAYQNAAAFVPKLASKVVGWLDAKDGERILDVGCGDGILTHQIASSIPTGHIHGTDASASMITTSQASPLPNLTYEVLDATKLLHSPTLQPGTYDKVFSNAALHWILRNPDSRVTVFEGIHSALKTGGTLAFEMGGQGNVSEMRTALLYTLAKKVGIEKAREADPWFFPDEQWMRNTLEKVGFEVQKFELEYRPTVATEGKGKGGGVEGWVRIMGKQFLDIIGAEGSVERDEAVKEICDNLETVCGAASGGYLFGYVRLRVLAKKI